MGHFGEPSYRALRVGRLWKTRFNASMRPRVPSISHGATSLASYLPLPGDLRDHLISASGVQPEDLDGVRASNLHL